MVRPLVEGRAWERSREQLELTISPTAAWTAEAQRGATPELEPKALFVSPLPPF
jgi:hypothetical protein